MQKEIQQITEETIKYAPLTVQAIVAIEQAAKGMPGQSKREIAIQTIQTSARVAQGVPNTSVAGIGALVDLLVTVFNATGLFTKAKAGA